MLSARGRFCAIITMRHLLTPCLDGSEVLLYKLKAPIAEKRIKIKPDHLKSTILVGAIATSRKSQISSSPLRQFQQKSAILSASNMSAASHRVLHIFKDPKEPPKGGGQPEISIDPCEPVFLCKLWGAVI